MEVQEVIAYVLVAVAVIFLVKKFFFTKKKNSCSGGAGCKYGHWTINK